jgi:hypothetical protein
LQVPIKVGSKAATPQNIEDHLGTYGFDKYLFATTDDGSIQGCGFWVLCVIKRLEDLNIVEKGAYQRLKSLMPYAYDDYGRPVHHDPLLPGTFTEGMRPLDSGEGGNGGSSTPPQTALPSGQQLGAVQRVVPSPNHVGARPALGALDAEHVGSSQSAAKKPKILPDPNLPPGPPSSVATAQLAMSQLSLADTSSAAGPSLPQRKKFVRRSDSDTLRL